MSCYEPVKFLGKGKFAMVYEVVDKRSSAPNARYAFKRVFVRGRSSLRCIERESSILQRLATANTQSAFVATLLHSFRLGNSMVFIETLASPATLKDIIKKFKGIRDELAIRFYLSEILCGLQFLHNNSIVHADVKPANIMLTHAGHVLIADMDCSFDLTTGPPRKGDFLGTQVFFAPEVSLKKDITPKSDVWSLGVTLAFMRFGFESNIRSYTSGTRACLNASEWMRDIDWRRVSGHLRDVFEACLTSEMGLRPSIEGVKQMHFFDGISWGDVEELKLTPPFPPTVRESKFRKNRVVMEAAHGEGLVQLPKSPFEKLRKREKGRQALKVLPPVNPEEFGWSQHQLEEFLNSFEFVNPKSLERGAS